MQMADELVASYPEVFQRELGALPRTVHLEVEQGTTPIVAPPPHLRPLNIALKRERYQLPVLEDILPELSKATVFSIVDLTLGYWHCVLAPESSVLMTFETPYGRYRWICLPFSLSALSEIFQKHLNHVLESLPGALCIADDILVYGTGEIDEEATANHDRSLQDLLQRYKDREIVLNPDKMKLRMSEVSFMGHLLTNKGLTPDPAKVEAIVKMPKPQDVNGIRQLPSQAPSKTV